MMKYLPGSVLQAYIDACVACGLKTIHLPPGHFLIKDYIRLEGSGYTLIGHGKGTILHYAPSVKKIFNAAGDGPFASGAARQSVKADEQRAADAFMCLLYRDDDRGACAFLLDMTDAELRRTTDAALDLVRLTTRRRRCADGSYTFANEPASDGKTT